MTQKDINNWIMYHDIHKFHRMGFSRAKIACHMNLDARTVSKYLKMNEHEFEQFLIKLSQRSKLLEPYESFVHNKLKEFPETSAAQIHDWIKEHHKDYIKASSRTVYNFVMYIRGKYNIPYQPKFREYFPIEELPYGQQAQVDFGEYNLRKQSGNRKKVRFFAMVLSRSRMKFVCFLDVPFTSETVISAHEKAFEFFRGLPQTIVYDQDRTIIVDENLGEIILTTAFKAYTKTRNFNLHFCRKADPESKGKIENVIGYIKKNFLYNRLYIDIETLNSEALAWLSRTANHLPHNTTKKSPESEYFIEREYLTQYVPLTIPKPKKQYTVRKDNTINYKSNFYSVPMGTYKGNDTYVFVDADDNKINIYNADNQMICSHNLSLLKGKKVTNTNHKRDTSKSLNELFDETSKLFTDKAQSENYLLEIKRKYSRHFRDHLQVISKAVKEVEQTIIDKTLTFCIKNQLYHANEFEQSMIVLMDDKTFMETYKRKEKVPGLLDTSINQKIEGHLPETSNIDDYESIINQNESNTYKS